MKLPPGRYIKAPPINLKLPDPHANTFIINYAAVVENARDEAIIAAIRQYAIEKGYEGIFVIDEEFVKSAIENELRRRECLRGYNIIEARAFPATLNIKVTEETKDEDN